jgi:hypothetical protein
VRAGTPNAAMMMLVALALTATACGPYQRAHEVTTPPQTAPPARSERVVPSPRSSRPAGSTVGSPSSRNRSQQPSGDRSRPDLSAFRGLATWIDVYDQSDVFGPRAFGDPARSVAAMVRHGVHTVFLEAGSYRHPPVAFPSASARFIGAAHTAGLKVVAWYLPLFRDVTHDFAEVMRTVGFRTPGGQGYDGFALDIEAALVPPGPRIANMLRLSAMIRSAVGPGYPLGAIIPSPRGLIRVPTYWPGFPYAELPRYYDVILPMSYFTFHYHGEAAVDQYIRDNVEIVRQSTGDPAIPVHVIGGIAGDMSPADAAAFVRAAVSERVFGASLYEFPGTSAVEWRLLAPLR